jgi:hypothetical protein
VAKTYTAPTTVSAGDAITASLYNTYVGTNVANLIVPPACMATATASQNVSTGTWTAMTFNTESYDTDSMHDNVTNNSRITINTTGIYLCTAYNNFAGSIAGSIRNMALRANGSTYIAVSQIGLSDSAQTISIAYPFTAGDYIEFAVYQSSGVTMTNDAARFGNVTWIGRTS